MFFRITYGNLLFVRDFLFCENRISFFFSSVIDFAGLFPGMGTTRSSHSLYIHLFGAVTYEFRLFQVEAVNTRPRLRTVSIQSE